MCVGLLTDRINNELGKSNLIKENALNREPVPFNLTEQVYTKVPLWVCIKGAFQGREKKRKFSAFN